MEFSYQTETRHNPAGKTCHHYARYRLTCDEFDALRVRSGGCCEICKTPEGQTASKKLCIDHYSRSGVSYVRGLLCNRCNTVMACLDGNKPWGANRIWEDAARQYMAATWLTPEEGKRLAVLRGPIDRW